MGVCGSDCARTETCAEEGRVRIGLDVLDDTYIREIIWTKKQVELDFAVCWR